MPDTIIQVPEQTGVRLYHQRFKDEASRITVSYRLKGQENWEFIQTFSTGEHRERLEFRSKELEAKKQAFEVGIDAVMEIGANQQGYARVVRQNDMEPNKRIRLLYISNANDRDTDPNTVIDVQFPEIHTKG